MSAWREGNGSAFLETTLQVLRCISMRFVRFGGALDSWIEGEIEKLTRRSRALPSLKKVPWEELDEVFLSIVKGCS